MPGEELKKEVERNTKRFENGLFFQKKEAFNQAIEWFSKITAPKWKHTARARCYEKMGLFELAIQEYYNINDWSDKDAISLGRCYRDMGLHKEAIETLQVQ